MAQSVYNIWPNSKLSPQLFCRGIMSPVTAATVVPFQVWHKLNYFLFCRIFLILIVSYDKKN
jgi:hypothetical protein